MAYYEAFDVEAPCVVWLMTGGANSDADFEAYLRSIARLDAVAAGRPGAAVLVVDAGNPPPSSAWRKKIADATNSVQSKPVFALVSASPIVRGVLTVLNWLRPPTYPATACATVQEAFAWVEAQLKRPMPQLPLLLADVRRQANAAH